MQNLIEKKNSNSVPIQQAIGNNGKKPLIQIHQLDKTYVNAAGEFIALKNINADFYQGEFIAVIGKSGSGKTTLINMITGIDRPTSGEVIVGDVPVHTMSEGQLATWRGRNLGIVFQFFQLLPMLSLIENIMLPMDFCHMYTARQRRERALELLRSMELEEHAYKLPSALSGGQQQRVAIARAMANDPPIIMADEPTGNLDSNTADIIFKIFDDLVSQGKTVVMVTHDSSMAKRVDRTLLIADGEIINEYVATALPLLEHKLMLEATHNLTPLHFDPGATVLTEGGLADKFYIVTQGFAEVVLHRPKGSDVIVSQMGVGQYFGEIELLRGGPNAATIRASEHTPLEVVAIERQTFKKLLATSEGMQAVIKQVADERLAENIETRTKDAK